MTLPIQALNSPNFIIESKVNTTSYKQALHNLKEHIDNMSNPFSAKDVVNKFAEILQYTVKYNQISSFLQECFESLSLSENTKSFINELGVAIENDLDVGELKSYKKIIMQIRQDLIRLSEHKLKDVDMCPELKQLLSLPGLKKLENSDIDEIINLINVNSDILEQNLAIELEKNSVNELKQDLVNELEKRLVDLLGSDVVRDINAQLEKTGFGNIHTLLLQRIHQYLKNAVLTLEKELPRAYIIKKIQGKKTLEFRFITIVKEGNPDIEKQKSIIKWLSWIFSNQQKKFVSIVLTNCAVLTNKKLLPFWHNNLKYLDLRYSSIDTKIVETISHQCKNLKKLYLSKCDQLEAVAARSYNSEDPLKFPNLKILHVSRCANLTRVNIDAPNLRILKANNNTKLKELSLLPLVEFNVDNCPLLVEFLSENNFFGVKDWERYFGDVGVEPPLPKNIVKILNEPCSFWPDKKVKDTHLLMLIPSTVNGNPFTLNYLGEIVRKPKSGHATRYCYYSDSAREAVGDKSYPSHWVFMTKNTIPGSRYGDEGYSNCVIANHIKKTGVPYELPNLLDATTSILMHYVKTGERLYSDNPCTYTHTKDIGKDGLLVSGCFAGGGLFVHGNGVSGAGDAVVRVL